MLNQSCPGVLVAIEGIDGAGKTTQVRSLERWLEGAGVSYVSTKEPTSGPWGQRIRASAQHGRMSPADETEAFILDRREHVRDVIGPALEAGKVVLVDRYYFSTVAYQGARGIDPAWLLERNAFAPEPDVLVVLDLEPRVGLARIRARGDDADLFEKEDELAKARAIFRQLPVANLVILDAMEPPGELTRAITQRIRDAIAAKKTLPGSIDESRVSDVSPALGMVGGQAR